MRARQRVRPRLRAVLRDTEAVLDVVGVVGRKQFAFLHGQELKPALGESEERYRRLVDSQEAERKRMARELHDGVGQLLAAVLLRVQVLQEGLAAGKKGAGKEVRQIKELLDQAMQETRRLSHNLRPSVLDDLGLLAALRNATDEFGRRTRVKLDFSHADLPERFPPETELALFRIVQEALDNVERHSGATRVRLRLEREGSRVKATVTDNGKGFGKSEEEKGFGLISMRERAACAGGSIQVKSAPGLGTEVTVRLPIERTSAR